MADTPGAVQRCVRTMRDLGPSDVVGVCVSGGLDSKTVCTSLKEAGVKVLSFSADLGQPDETDIRNVQERMRKCGVECYLVDCKDRIAELAFEVLQCQGRYDGGYWNTTGIGRVATVQGLLGEMKRQGCTVLAHGATGRGNDQFRFERYTNILDPDFKVFAPWRDPELLARFPGRKEMAEYLTAKGIEAFVGPKKKYSTDANLAGLSHEAEDLEQITTPMRIVDPEMTRWPQDAAAEGEDVVLRVEAGRVTALNGLAGAPRDILARANALGAKHGLGIAHALENRMLGTKSRGVYEAPGMELLGKAIEYVYQGTLERRSCDLLHTMSRFVASQIYDARYFDPSTQAAINMCKVLGQYASGTVTVHLYRGHIQFVSLVDVPHLLYAEADASMERRDDGLNPISSQGFAEIQGVVARRLAWAGQIPFKPM